MKLDVSRQGIGEKWRSQPQNWVIQKKESAADREPQPSTWVKLLELPSPFSFDEALLLCQLEENKWLAWIPDRGETVLHTRQFCTTG